MAYYTKVLQPDEKVRAVGRLHWLIFWPAAFFVGGDKQTAAELAQMKGQMVAVEQASNAKKCGIQFQGPRPPGT